MTDCKPSPKPFMEPALLYNTKSILCLVIQSYNIAESIK